MGLVQDENENDPHEGWHWVDGSTPGPDTEGIRLVMFNDRDILQT